MCGIYIYTYYISVCVTMCVCACLDKEAAGICELDLAKSMFWASLRGQRFGHGLAMIQKKQANGK